MKKFKEKFVFVLFVLLLSFAFSCKGSKEAESYSGVPDTSSQAGKNYDAKYDNVDYNHMNDKFDETKMTDDLNSALASLLTTPNISSASTISKVDRKGVVPARRMDFIKDYETELEEDVGSLKKGTKVIFKKGSYLCRRYFFDLTIGDEPAQIIYELEGKYLESNEKVSDDFKFTIKYIKSDKEYIVHQQIKATDENKKIYPFTNEYENTVIVIDHTGSTYDGFTGDNWKVTDEGKEENAIVNLLPDSITGSEPNDEHIKVTYISEESLQGKLEGNENVTLEGDKSSYKGSTDSGEYVKIYVEIKITIDGKDYDCIASVQSNASTTAATKITKDNLNKLKSCVKIKFPSESDYTSIDLVKLFEKF